MEAQSEKREMKINRAQRIGGMQDILTRTGIGMIIGLSVQYLLGMANNLFVIFPDTTDTSKLWVYAWTHVTEALHIIFGIFFCSARRYFSSARSGQSTAPG